MPIDIVIPATTADSIRFLWTLMSSGIRVPKPEGGGNRVQWLCAELQRVISAPKSEWLLVVAGENSDSLRLYSFGYESRELALSYNPHNTPSGQRGNPPRWGCLLDCRLGSSGQVAHVKQFTQILDAIGTGAVSVPSDDMSYVFLKHAALFAERAVDAGRPYLVMGWRRKTIRGDEVEFVAKYADGPLVARDMKKNLGDDGFVVCEIAIAQQDTPAVA